MTEAAATEFVRNFGKYQHAAQREAVAVKAHARIVGYFISPHDFAEYQAMKAQRRALAVEDFDEAMVAALETSRMDARHAPLDALIDDPADKQR